MFTLKQRPKGLEMSACHDCNHHTRLSDLVVALSIRAYPDVKGVAAQEELQSIMKSMNNNFLAF